MSPLTLNINTQEGPLKIIGHDNKDNNIKNKRILTKGEIDFAKIRKNGLKTVIKR